MARSPWEPSDSATRSPVETFASLGDETRVGILQAPWKQFESGGGGNALPHSVLFDEVEISDAGDFSYRLETLTGPFVRLTEDGYELKQTGINVVRAVVSGTVTRDPSFGLTGIDEDCPVCGAPLQIKYEDELCHASERELARYDLAPSDFPLVRSDPSLLTIAKLTPFGWDSTPHAEAIPPTVEEHLASGRTGRKHGLDRALERDAIDGITT